jgi:hypothetical protein
MSPLSRQRGEADVNNPTRRCSSWITSKPEVIASCVGLLVERTGPFRGRLRGGLDSVENWHRIWRDNAAISTSIRSFSMGEARKIHAQIFDEKA